MHIYSDTSISFVKRLNTYFKEILSNEVNLEVKRSRFRFNNYLIPFNIIIFEHPTKLGFFDRSLYQIGLNKNLMYSAKTEIIKNILRHEIAHFLVDLTYINSTDSPHGQHFQTICKKYNWGNDVSLSKINLVLENEKIKEDFPSEKIIGKIKKLLALASSSNKHEAKLATIKANQILLKFNLSRSKIDDSPETFLKRVITGRKVTGKHQAIYEILKHFFVYPVFNHGKGIFYLEVIGDRTNVELADYIANYLNRELENLWKNTKKENPSLKGATSKTSFMNGIAKGFISKIIESNTLHSKQTQLIIVNNALDQHIQKVYPRIRNSYFKSKHCKSSSDLGSFIGKNLNINTGIKDNINKIFLLE